MSAISAMDAASRLAYAARGESPGAPRELAREFEALLLGEVWKGALRPTGLGGGLDGGRAAQMYRERFVEEVMRDFSNQRGGGVARALEREMLHRAAHPAADGEGGT